MLIYLAELIILKLFRRKEIMCDLLERDDSHLDKFDKDLRENIKATRDRVVGIIKELSEFLHHERPNSRLIETLEFELEGAKCAQFLSSVDNGK